VGKKEKKKSLLVLREKTPGERTMLCGGGKPFGWRKKRENELGRLFLLGKKTKGTPTKGEEKTFRGPWEKSIEGVKTNQTTANSDPALIVMNGRVSGGETSQR